jgi:hypothetical protein
MPPLSSPPTSSGNVLVLAGTAALLSTDRRIEQHLPDEHFQVYQNSSNIALGGLAASLAESLSSSRYRAIDGGVVHRKRLNGEIRSRARCDRTFCSFRAALAGFHAEVRNARQVSHPNVGPHR